MAINRIRIRTSKAEREAIKRFIKDCINNNIVGFGPKYFMPSRINRLVMANRGRIGIPKILSEDTVPYLYRQMLANKEIMIREDDNNGCYLVTDEDPDRQIEKAEAAELIKQVEEANNNNTNTIKEEEKETMAQPEVKGGEDIKFKELNENKIEKSIRNTKEFMEAINRVAKGEFDEDIEDAYQLPLLKIAERWTIRKQFSLEEGKHFYKLYKEVFYLENPGKYYFQEVQPTIYRRIAAQHENGDKEWAEAVAKEMHISIVE
jgi:hypothetical protein